MLKRLARGFVVVLGLSLIIAYVVLAHMGYDTMSLPHGPYPPATPDGEYQDVSFPSRNQNYLVRAFYLPAAKSAIHALVLVHGYRGTRHDTYHLEMAGLLRDLGYTVVSVDLSDTGGDTIGNERISMGYSERWDVLGAYDYLLSKGFAPNQIGLVGESMGAATNLLAAAQEPRIRAVWADSAYGRADNVLAEQAQMGGLPSILVPGGMVWGILISGDRIWEAAPLDAGPALAANKQAVYLIHCEPDGEVLFHHSVDINAAYKSAGVIVTFWDVPDGEHATAGTNHREEYLKRLDEFFRRNLAG